MIIRKLRLQRGWSQDQLARITGLSVRTIQRLERGEKAGLESIKSLAAAFEVDVIELQQETQMKADAQVSEEERQAMQHVRDLKEFYSHVITYVVVIGFLFLINLMTNPGHLWAHWAALGWGVGLLTHGLSVFEETDMFGANWEKRQVEKRLGRKL